MFNNIPYMYGIFNPYQNQNQNYSNQQPNYQQQQMEQQNKTNMDWIRVNTLDDVANITLQPHTKAWIMLANEPVFVVKSADGMGLTTTDAYRFEKITGEAKPEYVTRQEFEAFKKMFEPEEGSANK